MLQINNQVCHVCNSTNTTLLFSTRYGHNPKFAGLPIKLEQPNSAVYHCNNCFVRFSYPTIEDDALIDLYEDIDTNVWNESPDYSKRRGFEKTNKSYKKIFKR